MFQCHRHHVQSLLLWLSYLGDGVMLCVRIFMGKVFFQSGLTKLDDWSNTVYLFREEYHVPVLPPAWAAFMGAGVELTCPVLLVLGLGTRLATLPMLAMTAVIEFLVSLRHAGQPPAMPASDR